MLTLLIIFFLLLIALTILLAIGAGGILAFGWLIVLLADVVLGIFLIVKVFKKIFKKKGGK